jgi:uncharacterized protein
MPHMCTRCQKVFDEGTDILKGCPVCGWKKFQFVKTQAQSKARRSRRKAHEDQVLAEPKVQVEPKVSPNADAQKELREKVEVGPKQNAETRVIIEKNAEYLSSETDVESIRITEPGTYELNLPSLFKREELIMAVKDGTYLIDLSSAFRKPKKD